MGPVPELKEYEPFLVVWIKECKKFGFPVSKRRLAWECSKNCDFSKIKMKERNKKIGNSNGKTEDIWRKKNFKKLQCQWNITSKLLSEKVFLERN